MGCVTMRSTLPCEGASIFRRNALPASDSLCNLSVALMELLLSLQTQSGGAVGSSVELGQVGHAIFQSVAAYVNFPSRFVDHKYTMESANL